MTSSPVKDGGAEFKGVVDAGVEEDPEVEADILEKLVL